MENTTMVVNKNETQKTIKKEIPDMVLLPYNRQYCRPENYVPEMLDTYSPTGYSDGKAKRRARREKQRKNKHY